MITIDDTWTLFLDRDGVINKKINNGYVLSIDDFEFLPGVVEVMPKLAKLFPRIIVVTNQQCIAKGLLTHHQLKDIHQNMMNLLELNGGRIDAIYYAPDLKSDNNILRKPQNGMAILAKSHFPEINFSKCIMVGDHLTDMEFGKSVGMITVHISDNYKKNELIDYVVSGLDKLTDYINF